MSKISILILLVLTIQYSWAQDSFEKGFVIQMDGDTLYGLIAQKGSIINANKCYFKPDSLGEVIVFGPKDIAGYRITNGKYFISRKVNINQEIKLVFLEFLINGIVNVYFYRDLKGDHYFAENEKGVLHELKNTPDDKYINGTRFKINRNEYVGVLKVLFKDSPPVTEKVDQVKLNHGSLIKIANKYHRAVCDENIPCIIYEKTLPEQISFTGWLVGFSSMGFSDGAEQGTYQQFDIESFNRKPLVHAGLFHFRNIPMINEKFGILLTMNYSSIKLAKKTKDEGNLIILHEEESLVNHTLTNHIAATYELSRKSLQPFLLMGIFSSYNFISNYQYEFKAERKSDGVIQGEESTTNSPFMKFDFGYDLGVGVKTSQIFNKPTFLLVKYQKGQGFRKNLTTNQLSLNIGLSF